MSRYLRNLKNLFSFYEISLCLLKHDIGITQFNFSKNLSLLIYYHESLDYRIAYNILHTGLELCKIHPDCAVFFPRHSTVTNGRRIDANCTSFPSR